MTTSQRGINLIKDFEGCKLKVYLCPAGVPTIGYGRTKDVTMATKPITAEQAESYLKEDLLRYESGVKDAVKVPLTQGQFDALVSFSFNVGLGSLRGSTLLKRLNEGKYTLAADQFRVWNMAAGKAMPGLTRRRAAEKVLFMRADDTLARADGYEVVVA